MTPFNQTILEWHDFFVMVGGGSAALVGLLFVGLSLHVDDLRRREHAYLLICDEEPNQVDSADRKLIMMMSGTAKSRGISNGY